MDLSLYKEFYDIEDWFWWSVGTRRTFFDVLDEEGIRGGRALDVGCGTGVMLKEFPDAWQLVVGSDNSAVALSFCRQRGLRDLVRSDATRLPFASGSIDLVTALDVIEHLDEDAACMREMARVCRVGGYVLLHVPAFRLLWTDKDDLNHHRRRYRRSELIELVERGGLSVERTFYVNSFLFPLALVHALGQRAWRGIRRTTHLETAAAVTRLYHLPGAGLINRLMTGVMAVERHVTTQVPLPFGMSLGCLARKRR